MNQNAKSLEKKDFNNLSKLLNDNILTSSGYKSSKYVDYFAKTNANIYSQNQRNSDLDNSKKKFISFSMIKYKPKRLITFKDINIPLPNLGKGTLDYTKTIFSQYRSKLKKAQTENLYDYKTVNTNNTKSKIDHIIKDDKLIEFKTLFVLKYAQYSEEFSKFHSYKDYLTEPRKREFENSLNKIIKNLDTQSHTLLDDYVNEDKLTDNNNNIFSPYITSTSVPQNSYKLLSNINNNYSMNKKKITVLCSDYSYLIIKLINILFKELNEYKNENMKLLKKNYEQEIKTNLVTKELDDLKHYVNKYNIYNKIYDEKIKENSIRKIKDKFAVKENEYFISIYKLQEEIHSLIKLLDKNKEYYDKFKEVQKEVLNNKKNNTILKSNFNRQLQQKDVLFALERDKQEELLDKLEKLNNIIEEFKDEKENQKRQEIEIKAQIKQMKIVVDERSENIMMMSEELEHYIRELNREKYNHQNTLNELRTLENRYFKDGNEEEKKQDKEENKELQLKL